MKTRIAAILLVLFLILPTIALAGGSNTSTRCKTNYPVVLAHGMFATSEILGIVDYWWGIEGALKKEGASVYITAVNAMDGTHKKAVDFRNQYLQILAVSGKAKANIIGHSHGAIYTRYAMSNLGLGSKVASLTSLSGPHQGSALADIVMFDLPSDLLKAAGSSIDWLFAFLFGDTNPDVLQNGYDVTTTYMKNVFNPNTPNVAGVYYQSYAAKAKWSCPSIVLEPLWVVLLIYEGANDGVVSVNSAKWGNYRGAQEAAWYSPGVDHINMVGHLFGLTPGFDAPKFYTDIVADLKSRGY
ncbi:MAG: alpha/beta hydrolase [Desulfatibacillaceae bacterium]|nr:alpha/beta hydrolase [Desulfatibacillaceae bacterium]